MVDDALRWVIGLGVTIIVAFTSALIAGFYRLADAIRKGDAELHVRVNDVRDEYARRTDLDGHMSRMDMAMRDMRNDMKEQHRDTQRRLDSVLAALNRAHSPPPEA